MSSDEKQRVILVTGANRGIGFSIVKKLANESSSFNRTTILLGSRDLQRGQDTLIQLNSSSNVRVLQLDTSSKESIIRATNEIKDKHGGQLDVVINNAALSTKEITADAARKIFNTNYYGIKMLNEHLFPLMRENGRIINVSSRVGSMMLHETSPALQETYTSSTLTKDQLDHLVEDFISAIGTNSLETVGYKSQSPYLIYGVSKTALNALTQVEARQWSKTKNLLIVSVTPGFCATDMAEHAVDARPAELGADSILYVVNAPPDELENGGFYRDGQQIPLIEEPLLK